MIRDPMMEILESSLISRRRVMATLSVKSRVCIHLKLRMFQILTFPLSSALAIIGVCFTRVKQVTADS